MSYAGIMAILHRGMNSLRSEGPSLYGDICCFTIGVVRARNRWRDKARAEREKSVAHSARAQKEIQDVYRLYEQEIAKNAELTATLSEAENRLEAIQVWWSDVDDWDESRVGEALSGWVRTTIR